MFRSDFRIFAEDMSDDDSLSQLYRNTYEVFSTLLKKNQRHSILFFSGDIAYVAYHMPYTYSRLMVWIIYISITFISSLAWTCQYTLAQRESWRYIMQKLTVYCTPDRIVCNYKNCWQKRRSSDAMWVTMSVLKQERCSRSHNNWSQVQGLNSDECESNWSIIKY
jgi:hypothetical protein